MQGSKGGDFLSKRTFEYGGYNFFPVRKLEGSESGFFAISKRISIDADVLKLVNDLFIFCGWKLNGLKAIDELTDILIHSHIGGG